MTRAIEWVVVHTAGAFDFKNKRVVYQTYEVIDRYHREHNGWRMCGYHYVIEEDGAVIEGRNEDTVGAHVGGFNEASVGICVTGHGDFAPFKPAQLASLVRLCTTICQRYRLSGIRVIGHREAPDHGATPTHKTCPGTMVDMNEIRRLVADRLEST